MEPEDLDDVMARVEEDPNPEEVQAGDPSYVEPWRPTSEGEDA